MLRYPLLILFLASTATADSRLFAPRSPAITLRAKEPLRFVIAGDTGARATIRNGIAAVHSRSPLDGIILLGDNFYDCGVSSVSDVQWRAMEKNFGSLGIPLYPLLGNHDYGNPSLEGGRVSLRSCTDASPQAQVEATGVIRNWFLPARNYVVGNDLVDFVMFDTTPLAVNATTAFLGSPTAEASLGWLRRELARSNARWTIVAGHHVIHSSGRYGVRADEVQQRMRRLERELGGGKVALYMCGHDHHLELLAPAQPRGPHFLISGAAMNVRPSGLKREATAPSSLYVAKETYAGFATLEVWRDRLVIVFYDAAGAPRSRPLAIRHAP